MPNALLRVGRNCVARRVTAVWGSVSDETSMRAADVDLVARGLALVGFPLREAIIRYRARQPRKYARDGAPRTSVALRRVLTTAHVTAFLQTFAEKLPLGTALEDAPHWLPGDIILVKPSRRRAKLMLAIVSDRTDDAGMSLLLTLDPADKRARELHNLHSYPVRGHFRLRRDQLERARAKLGMAKSRSPVTL